MAVAAFRAAGQGYSPPFLGSRGQGTGNREQGTGSPHPSPLTPHPSFLPLPLILFLLAAPLFAEESVYKYVTPFEVTSTRELGAGGVHPAYDAGITSILSNPATLYLQERKTVFGLQAALEGELGARPGLILDIFRKDPINGEQLKKFIDDRLITTPPALNITGPLYFGRSGKGFGFAVFNKLYIDSQIHYSDSNIIDNMRAQYIANLNNDIIGAAGWSFNLIDSDVHKLYLGINAKLLFRSVSNLLTQDYMEDGSTDVPVGDEYSLYRANIESAENSAFNSRAKILAGAGCNGALLYKLSFLTLSLTVSDILSGGGAFFTDEEGGAEFFLLHPNVSAGAGFNFLFEDWFEWRLFLSYNDMFYKVIFPSSGRDMLLNLSLGNELVLLKKYSIRAGLSEMSPYCGFGVDFSKIKVHIALYGKQYDIINRDFSLLSLALGVEVSL